MPSTPTTMGNRQFLHEGGAMFWIIFWTAIGVSAVLFLYFIWLIKRINDTEYPGMDEIEFPHIKPIIKGLSHTIHFKDEWED